MKYTAAIREIDDILADLAEKINASPSLHQYNLERIPKDIKILVGAIFANEPDKELANHWHNEYNKAYGENKMYRYEPRVFRWAEFLKMLKRDLERRERLEQASPAPLSISISVPTQQQQSYRLPFFIVLLTLLSSWIWMVPVLTKKSDWFWQMVGQILVTMVIIAIYFKFSRKKWFTTVGIALLAVVAVILFQQEDLKQQAIAGGWVVIWTVIATGLWELIRQIGSASKNI